MIEALILAFGIVLILEGLAIALAPLILDDLVEFLKRTPPRSLVVAGLLSFVLGCVIVIITNSNF